MVVRVAGISSSITITTSDVMNGSVYREESPDLWAAFPFTSSIHPSKQCMHDRRLIAANLQEKSDQYGLCTLSASFFTMLCWKELLFLTCLASFAQKFTISNQLMYISLIFVVCRYYNIVASQTLYLNEYSITRLCTRKNSVYTFMIKNYFKLLITQFYVLVYSIESRRLSNRCHHIQSSYSFTAGVHYRRQKKKS